MGHSVHLYNPGGSVGNYLFPTGRLLVTIVKARGIRGDEFRGFGMADPYAEIKLGGRDHGQIATTVIAKDAGQTPVWNQAFPFPIKSQHEEYNELWIAIYNKNHWPRKDNMLGYILMKNMCHFLSSNGNMVRESWYPLAVFSGDDISGEICLAFNFIPMSPSALLTETFVMGNASTHGHSHRENDWGNMVVALGVGAVQIGLAAAGL